MADEKTTYYSGFLMLDSGLKVFFTDIEEENMDAILLEAENNLLWKSESTDIIWLADSDLYIPAARVAGFSIYSRES